jgi:hypothetical protein
MRTALRRQTSTAPTRRHASRGGSGGKKYTFGIWRVPGPDGTRVVPPTVYRPSDSVVISEGESAQYKYPIGSQRRHRIRRLSPPRLPPGLPPGLPPPPSVWSQLHHSRLDPSELQKSVKALGPVVKIEHESVVKFEHEPVVKTEHEPVVKTERRAPTTLSLKNTALVQKWSERDTVPLTRMVVDADGNQNWVLKDGTLHRDDDLPAFIGANGNLHWYQYGKLHRDNDRPAKVNKNGSMSWYQHNELHRDGDEPAVVEANGSLQWYQRGQLHRGGDRPAQITKTNMSWYWRGKRHRDDNLPAVIRSNGKLEFWKYGVKIA